jgi:hypothetical protein
LAAAHVRADIALLCPINELPSLQLIASWRMPWPAWIGHACGWPLILAGLAVTIGVALLVSGCAGETAKPTTQAGTTTTTPTAARAL